MNQSMNQRDMFFKWLYYAGAVLLLVLVQSLVLNRISVWAVHPFLPPVIAGIMAMLEGPAEGAVFGGIFGLLCDLTMPGVIPCFYTLAFLAAALPAAMIAKRLLLNPYYKKPCTFEGYYNKLIGQIGNDGSTFQSASETLTGALSSIDNQRQQTMGVSSDEELTHMIKFQSAYNASSRFMTVISQMTELSTINIA